MDLSSSDLGRQVVRAYLSRQHFENAENSCPMVALPSYVARSGQNVKRAFETVFKAMVTVLERSLVDKKRHSHAKAQAIAALCVGRMVVARSMVDRAIANELRDACIAVALRLAAGITPPIPRCDRSQGGAIS